MGRHRGQGCGARLGVRAPADHPGERRHGGAVRRPARAARRPHAGAALRPRSGARRQVWREFFDAGRLHVETDERRLDGDPVWVEGDYICLYAPDGRIIGHFGIQRDITAAGAHDEEVRRSREELRALAARLQSVREDERTRISREVHDELGQALTGLRLDLSWLKGRLKDRPELAERVQSAVTRIDGTIDTVRRIATELRPSVLDHLGLVAAVEWQAQEFEKRTGITVRLELSSAHPAVDDARATTVFRILQESLTNVARHAGASQVDIALALGPDAVTLSSRRRRPRHQRGRAHRAPVARPGGHPGAGDRLRRRMHDRGAAWAGDHGLRAHPARRIGGAMIRLCIADDHPVVRAGLKQIIEDEPGMEVVGEAADGDRAARDHRPHAGRRAAAGRLDAGTRFPRGAQGAEAAQPSLPVLVLSVHPEDQYAVRALRAGAAGYLTKDHSPEELVAAIRKVHRGGKYVSASLAERLAVGLEIGAEGWPHEKLSDREYDVLCQLGSGRTVKEISEQLGLSPKTVSTYRSRILEKMKLAGNADLVRYASQHGLIR